MDLIDVFQRLGLAVAIGAAVGVERHWRERDEPEGARIAGIRTFTLIGMTGGIAGLLDQGLTPDALSGLIVASFLISIALVLLRFGLMEARAEGSFSATTVIAGSPPLVSVRWPCSATWRWRLPQVPPWSRSLPAVSFCMVRSGGLPGWSCARPSSCLP